MTTQEKYDQLNETIVPEESLLARTCEKMLEEAQKLASEPSAAVPETQRMDAPKPSAGKDAPRHQKNAAKEGRKGLLIFARAMSYVAVAAASALICAVVLKGGPLFGAADKSAAYESAADMNAAEYPQSAEPESAEQMEEIAASDVEEEFADVQIYYVDGAQVLSKTQNLSCSIEEVFRAWAQENGVSGVEVEGVTLEGEDQSVMGVRIDFSQSLAAQLDGDGLMLQALSATMAAYLNADGVVLTVGGQPL